MVKEILTAENLIEIENNLSKFKEHHQREGSRNAHKLIKEKIKEDNSTRDGSPGMDKYYEGYDRAIKQVLELLQDKLCFP